MPTYKVNGNRVAADEPEPNDTHVHVVWFGPSEDGVHRKVFEGPLQPIEDYDAALAWAIEMAKYMARPIYVVPLTGAQALRSEPMQQAFAGLSDQQRGELRQRVVSMLVGLMRDCNDSVVRTDAHDVLTQMKVIYP